MYEPAYLFEARKALGQTESLGPNDSPWIRKMLAAVNGLWLKGQPWCGSAMAYWMQQSNLAYPKDYYRALSWANWGQPESGPRLGSVAVLTREGGGHVGIVTGITRDGQHVRLLGANQSDGVRESWFSVRRVTAYRRPNGAWHDVAPTALLGALSSTEA